jgi:hypothetical protein
MENIQLLSNWISLKLLIISKKFIIVDYNFFILNIWLLNKIYKLNK